MTPPAAAAAPYSWSMSGRWRHIEARPRQHRTAAEQLRRWTIPAIGALTPVGLIVVNIAAFIVHHLTEFRWSISVLAFVSGVLLNSWAALKIYRVARSRHPNSPLLSERNQELVLVVGLVIIIGVSFVTALFSYQGLSSEKNLPNSTTFITGVVAIAIPVVLQAIFTRIGEASPRPRRREGGRSLADPHDPLPPPPPPITWRGR